MVRIGALLSGSAANGAVAVHAAEAYARLLLSNKLKVMQLLGAVGSALASSGGVNEGGGAVRAIARFALRRLLDEAPANDRAALVMGVFHQTPAQLRAAAMAQVAPLLTLADRQCDPLATQAVNVALAAVGDEAGAAAAALLHHLCPSAPTLDAMKSALSSAGIVPALGKDVRRALREFVQRGAAAGGAAGGGAVAQRRGKRGRTTAQDHIDLLSLLAAGEARKRRRD
jgi:hypothetical protein